MFLRLVLMAVIKEKGIETSLSFWATAQAICGISSTCLKPSINSTTMATPKTAAQISAEWVKETTVPKVTDVAVGTEFSNEARNADDFVKATERTLSQKSRNFPFWSSRLGPC